jgi:AcrR family transcriptional regulator
MRPETDGEKALTAADVRSSRPATDRRTQRTRGALVEAFRAQFFEEGYDAITPTRLAAAANVGRSTFYEHFSGVDEVLALSVSRILTPIVTATFRSEPDLEMTETLQHIWDNRRFGRAMLAGGARVVIGRILAEMFEAGLAERRPRAAPKPTAAYMAAGVLAVLDLWLAGRAPGSAAQIAQTLHAAGHASAAALSGEGTGRPEAAARS